MTIEVRVENKPASQHNVKVSRIAVGSSVIVDLLEPGEFASYHIWDGSALHLSETDMTNFPEVAPKDI